MRSTRLFVLLLCVACASEALGEPNFSIHHFKEARPLELDVSRVAVHRAATSGFAADALWAAIGVEADGVKPIPIPGWSLAAIPKSRRNADEVVRIVAAVR